MHMFINTRRGFTLIELLVAVLIIGILAAVAVPQYKKAVLKSRFSTVFPMVKAISQGNENYYLANGEYATKLPSLDIDKPEGDNSGVLVGLKSTTRYDYVLGTRQEMNNNYIMYQKHSPNFADNIHCEAKTDDTQANDLCKSFGGTQIGGSLTDGYTTYILQGNAADGHLPTTYKNKSNITLSELDKCVATGQGACGNNTYNEATCYADHWWGCWNGTYRNESMCDGKAGGGACFYSSFYDSTCKGNGFQSCSGAKFYSGSECVGKAEQTCRGGNGSLFNDSTCYGNNNSTCDNTSFTNNATCVMNHSGACQGNTYSNGGGCQNGTNGTCPAGTPQPGGWDAATKTYTPAGWNGGYCNPSAMASGKCPAGSPTSTSGTCWDGNGNEVSCS